MAGETNSELKALTDRFVRVRLIQMGGVDLSTFQFDPLLSWSVFFMNADKTIYGRFGRAHPQSKLARRDSNPNHTVPALKAALERALEFHEAYEEQPEEMGKLLAGKTGPTPRWPFAEQSPAARKYGRLKRVKDGEHGCVHCHEVIRTQIDSHFMIKQRVPDKMLYLYPRPPVIGLEMDNTQPARVTRVLPGSAAAKAGIRADDRLAALDGQPLLSIADIQWVLHNQPDEGGDVPVRIERGDETKDLTLELARGWRLAEDFGWRYRMAGYAAWLWAGVSLQDHPEGVRVSHRSPGWFKRTNRDARRALAPGDVITRVDGRTGMDRSAFLAYLMRDKSLGSTVKLEVQRKGKTERVSFKIPRKQPEVQGH